MTNDELLDAAHQAHVVAHGLECGWKHGAPGTKDPCVMLWRAWRLLHPAEARRLWVEGHREELAAKQRAWGRDHPDQRREYLARPEVRDRNRELERLRRQTEHQRERQRAYQRANRAHLSEMERLRYRRLHPRELTRELTDPK